MPWKAFKRGDEWCVFKIDADDAATGDSLGCHDTRAKANSQVAALNANVKEGAVPVLIEQNELGGLEWIKQQGEKQMNDTMLESTTLEIDGHQVTMADLVSEYQEAHHHEWNGGEDIASMPVGSWSAMSFADIKAAREAEELAATVEQRTDEFQRIFRNIMFDSETTDKRAALLALVDEFVTEIEAIEVEEAAEGLTELAENDGLSILEILEVQEQEEDAEPRHTIIRVALIEPGLGNMRDKHYYPREMLERDAHIFQGVKMYATEHNDKERSVRTEVSQILRCPVGFSETGAPLADVAIYDREFDHNVRERDHHGTLSDLHCSILASGRVKKGVEMDGEKVNVVEAITEARAVDWVTRAGAGGRALSLVENDAMPEGNMTEKIVLDEGQSGEEDTENHETVEEQLHEQDEQQEQEQLEPLTVVEALALLLESGLSAKQQKRLAAKGFETAGELEGAIAEVKDILSESRTSTVLDMGKSKPKQAKPETTKSLVERESAVLKRHGIGR
ncbi:hypothetical protein LCGC14_0500470 [marine sediment metagenome]|uniref:Uncharacterized protein n=1 Tax=marine sediment metagenome TaxID=412755 RepID=A0A0F9VCQ9_9ZZZZ